MDDTEYRQYNFVRSASTLVLESSWPYLKSKIGSLMEEIKKTPLSATETLRLESTLETFEKKYINRVISSQKPSQFTLNLKFEPEEVYDVIIGLPQIYADFFDVFLSNVNFKSKDSWHMKMNDSIKFRAYNLDLRDKKNKDDFSGITHNPKFDKCDFENGYSLSKQNTPKGQLMQGFWQVEGMLVEFRNHLEHWRKRGSRQFVEKTLKRKIQDPISEIESPANFVILTSILVLISYQFIEVMQTWLDTIEILNNKAP